MVNKANILLKEAEKYASNWDQIIDWQWELTLLLNDGKDINLININELNIIELHDAYLDCKSNYPVEFPTTATIQKETIQEETIQEEQIAIQNNKCNKCLSWRKLSSGTYHAFIQTPYFQYGLTISNEEGRWLIWGEDHDVTDYDENLNWQGKIVGFKTLWQAKKAAEDIRDSMQQNSEAW